MSRLRAVLPSCIGPNPLHNRSTLIGEALFLYLGVTPRCKLTRALFSHLFGSTIIAFGQVVSDLSKFQSLCEEVIDLDHLQESAGKQVRVRPQFHAELQRLGQELSDTSRDMMDVVKDVEKASKVRVVNKKRAKGCCDFGAEQARELRSIFCQLRTFTAFQLSPVYFASSHKSCV